MMAAINGPELPVAISNGCMDRDSTIGRKISQDSA
jgi:hypothetical protein